MVKVPNKFLLALKWAHIGPKRGQNEVLGHFHVQNALVFANFAYYDSELNDMRVASFILSFSRKCSLNKTILYHCWGSR